MPTPGAERMVLEVVNAGISFGGVRALDSVSCHVGEGVVPV